MTSKVIYKGDLETECIHLKSNESIRTDAPLDNRGKASAFSPTDLCATSLATCMLTVMGIWARDNEVNMDGAYAEVTKHMGTDPRRIIRIDVNLFFPANNYSDREKSIFRHIADTCPVAKSLHPEIEQAVVFNW
ncbi:MAG: OsmC family protein [Saprospiraceae bacterium]|nr:OsmC family protein [Saprospiraceae bacterium]